MPDPLRPLSPFAVLCLLLSTAPVAADPPCVPELLDSFDEVSHVAVVAMGDWYIAAGLSSGDVQMVDASDPTALHRMIRFEAAGDNRQFVLVGDTLYIAGGFWGGLTIYDLSNPRFPERLGFLRRVLIEPNGVAVRGDWAFVADDREGLKVVDVSDPTAPQLVAALAGPIRSAQAVAVEGDIALVTDRNPEYGLHIIDVSEPMAPSLIRSYRSPDSLHFNEIAVSDGVAFVTKGWYGVEIIDVSVPDELRRLHNLTLPGYVGGLAVAENRLFVAKSWDERVRAGFWVYDISAPALPQLVGIAESARSTGEFALRDGIIVAPTNLTLDTYDVRSCIACYADCDGSGGLDFFDFLCFQNQFAAGDPQADCDESGALDFFDFLCFQNAFAVGCE